MVSNIHEVARLAGVSISTVSRVFTNKAVVNPDVREKVLACAKECNYKPNFFAKGLRSGRSKTIAFIIPDIENPIYPPLIHGAEDCVNDLGYVVLLCNTGESAELEASYISSLSNGIVEGFLIAPTDEGASQVERLRERNIPVVCVSRGLRDGRVDMVGIDNTKAGYEATKHLTDQGHRTIAMLSGKGAYVYEHRLEGYKKALEEAGIPFREELVYLINSVDINECARAVESIFPKKSSGNPIPDAIFAGSDPKGIGAIHAFKKMGYSIPKDISIISVDDLYLSEFMTPPLTTVRQPFYDMGAAGAQMLIDRIENGTGKRGGPIIKRLPTELIIRGSTLGDKKTNATKTN